MHPRPSPPHAPPGAPCEQPHPDSHRVYSPAPGEVPERLNGLDSKSSEGASPPRVRIPASPPASLDETGVSALRALKFNEIRGLRGDLGLSRLSERANTGLTGEIGSVFSVGAFARCLRGGEGKGSYPFTPLLISRRTGWVLTSVTVARRHAAGDEIWWSAFASL